MDCEHDHTQQIIQLKVELDGKIEFNSKSEVTLMAIREAKEEGKPERQCKIVIHGDGPGIISLWMDLGEHISKNIDPPKGVRAMVVQKVAKWFLPEEAITGDIETLPPEAKLKIMADLHKKLFGASKDVPVEGGGTTEK